ncbi:glutamyl-/ glutaminyl-tRNA synthetase [Pseudooceanicola batsensis HTCC2597]|uniref:Glutamyl-/ glutaminyl-tRNA synthetase n=1 Tax=Pseudooceanicola batsensis (strain ATCC BAA-863 / DSM 15984 / KCTC 12145 / HTCC2597) TaxID=252305 RepID=A3TWW6_PSEBH|nr:tRNA glutamyl-Q(34) synthetase GluQRS [Pseudooceanicola batsensis]EAQ03326.1 glutamyl-/ glutaminyl-tRNA synthetase [Pseudooceanicola batsensis HTCC2597]
MTHPPETQPDSRQITRFAPSPTGPLHLGHAYSALIAAERARAGTFHLRIEDIDTSRARPEWEERIFDDLHWLGLRWPVPVMRQSERLASYRMALRRLWEDGLLYRCTCRRRDIEAALSAPQEGAPLHGPDGLIYPGTCRESGDRGPARPMPEDGVLRLDMGRAVARTGALTFRETGSGPNGETGDIALDPQEVLRTTGDIILARRDMGTSYHLSVVIDDAEQNITEVTRGQDLFEATRIHVVLQALLGLPTPVFHHHRLIRDDHGKRLAKRDDARAIAAYRAEGATPADIRRIVGL